MWIMGISKTSDHIQIKIKMPNPSQEPAAFSKGEDAKYKQWISSILQSQNKDLGGMEVFCIFKIMKAKIWNKGSSSTSDQIMIKKLTPKPKLELGLKLKKQSSS